MNSITVRNLSEETKARLRRQAVASGRRLEAYVRTLLDQAAGAPSPASAAGFPHDLIALAQRMAVATRVADDVRATGVRLINPRGFR
jgi:plasmid stability protein